MTISNLVLSYSQYICRQVSLALHKNTHREDENGNRKNKQDHDNLEG